MIARVLKLVIHPQEYESSNLPNLRCFSLRNLSFNPAALVAPALHHARRAD